ncbi:Uncharacterised protein [Escherichia coli]|nr:Uncharacterised protein [Escherichia coli]
MKKILLMLSLLFFTTAGFSEVSDTFSDGRFMINKRCLTRLNIARKETDKFIEVMNKKDADTFAVKAPDNRSRKNRAFSGLRMSLILTACLLA